MKYLMVLLLTGCASTAPQHKQINELSPGQLNLAMHYMCEVSFDHCRQALDVLQKEK